MFAGFGNAFALDDYDDVSSVCAKLAFEKSLADTADQVTEDDPEHLIQGWIYRSFQKTDTIRAVLACPEVAELEPEDTIRFPPVVYIFPGGREIIVNYATQPKILKQRVQLSGKRGLPAGTASERVDAAGDWANTEPAWYGIMVVQAGTLDEFVGADKNNTISLKYLEQNWKSFYPHNHNDVLVRSLGGVATRAMCTSTSALADDGDIVNIAVHRTIGEEVKFFSGNDFYVAGDVNLQWITWAEVTLDVAITVVTWGGGTILVGISKGARAGRISVQLAKRASDLRKIDKVKDFERNARAIARQEKMLKTVKDASAVNPAEIAQKAEQIKRIEDNLKRLKTIDTDLKKLKDVQELMELMKVTADIQKYAAALKGFKVAQTGNVVARAWRAMRAARGGKAVLKTGKKAARVGMKSGKIRDVLFHWSWKRAENLGKMVSTAGGYYGAINFLLDMYDWSETSVGDYTSNIEFKPLLLLSADNLEGQENVVNHGMWFMWAGDSTSAADDDAAFLQSMDFAEKFYQDMEDIQDEYIEKNESRAFCNVDIYVVRPIVRSVSSEDPELYYLIMNDEPWRVRSH